MTVDQLEGGLGVELAAGHDGARHRGREDELGEAPRVKHRCHDDDGLLGAPRCAVKDRLEDAGSAVGTAGVLGALGTSGGARRQQDDLASSVLARCGCCPACSPIIFSTVRPILWPVGPGDDPRRVGFVGQRAVDGVGELLVVDDGVDAFALHDLGQRGSGERCVQQQHVGTDPVGGDQRLDEAAVVAGHDAENLARACRQVSAARRRMHRRAGRFRARSACRARRRGRAGRGSAVRRRRIPM